MISFGSIALEKNLNRHGKLDHECVESFFRCDVQKFNTKAYQEN